MMGEVPGSWSADLAGLRILTGQDPHALIMHSLGSGPSLRTFPIPVLEAPQPRELYFTDKAPRPREPEEVPKVTQLVRGVAEPQ